MALTPKKGYIKVRVFMDGVTSKFATLLESQSRFHFTLESVVDIEMRSMTLNWGPGQI